jgi:deoxyribose-phosphate aldolase
MTPPLHPFRGDQQDLASRIEHTILHPQSTRQEVVTAAQQARDWRVRSLVVKPCYVSAAAELLKDSGV